MLNELKKQEKAWGEFEDYAANKSPYSFWLILNPDQTAKSVAEALMSKLLLSFLDSVGIYITPFIFGELTWSYSIRTNKNGEAECLPIQNLPTFPSRALAEEAGIIRAFGIREEQLTKEK